MACSFGCRPLSLLARNLHGQMSTTHRTSSGALFVLSDRRAGCSPQQLLLCLPRDMMPREGSVAGGESVGAVSMA